MCAGYGMLAHGRPGGKPLPDWSPPPKPGGAPPPDRVNNQEVESQTNRQRLADEAQADYESGKKNHPDKPINWRERTPSRDDPAKIRYARLQSGGPKKGRPGKWEYIDENRHQLKLNPDGTPAYGFDRSYYEDLDNWYSKSEWEGFFNDSPESGNEDGVNL